MNFAELETKRREDLMEMAKDLGISGYSALKKNELIFSLLQFQAEKEGNVIVKQTQPLPMIVRGLFLKLGVYND